MVRYANIIKISIFGLPGAKIGPPQLRFSCPALCHSEVLFLCHSEEPSPLCHSEERSDEESNTRSFFATLRICSPQNFCEQLAVFLFLYFLVQESTKEPLHGVNGGIRLRSFAERARKTYAVPNTRSGRSLPRRTKPRHFHECGISQESFAGPAGAVALWTQAGRRATYRSDILSPSPLSFLRKTPCFSIFPKMNLRFRQAAPRENANSVCFSARLALLCER